MDPVKVGMDSIRRFEAKKARAAGSCCTGLLAALIYHEGKAEVAEVYGRLHPEADIRAEWQKTRNRHLTLAQAIREANSITGGEAVP